MSIFSGRRARRRRRRQPSRSHWWSETPWWAWVLIVLGAAALAAATTFALQRQRTPAASDSAVGAPGAIDTRIVVIGDSYTTSAAQGRMDPSAWPALLQERIDAASVNVSAADGAGYVVANVFGRTIESLAAAAPMTDADLVIIFGGRADGPASVDEVAVAARDVLALTSAMAPGAGIIVIGPAWPGVVVPAEIQSNRDAIRGAAREAGVTFVDPLAEGWFVGQPGLMADDGIHPTQEGQRYLADVIEPFVSDAIT